MKFQKIFNFDLNNDKEGKFFASNLKREDGYWELRKKPQQEALDQWGDDTKVIVNAPTASGKTLLICAHTYTKLIKHKNLRCVITVPQQIISSGFTEKKNFIVNGHKVNWKIDNATDLCSTISASDKDNTKKFIKWLSSYSNPIHIPSRILVCCHATLINVYKELIETNQLNLLKDLLLWIDESHHLQYDNEVESNNLGKIVAYLFKQETVHLGLSTATFFRGDRANLLTKEMESEFNTYSLPYDEYLSQMKYLKSFSYDFILCGPDYVKALELLPQGNSFKDIIYLPYYRSNPLDKHKETRKIIGVYSKHYGEPTSDGILTTLGKNFNIIDLVDESRRDSKKEFLKDINEEKSNLDAIIALGMFKEGANWIWANRSIIAGMRNLQENAQMIGRLFRDAKDKEHVQVIVLLSLSFKDKDKLKEELNEYLKAILMTLILQNVICPQISEIKEKKKKGESGKKHTSKNYLAEALGAEEQLSLLEDITQKMLTVNKNGTCSWDEYQEFIFDVLEQHGINEHTEEISNQIWAINTKKTLELQGIDTKGIEFNKLQEVEPLGWMLHFTSGVCDVKTFTELQKVICENSEINKLALLEMARNGKPKPKPEHALYNALMRYTNPSSDCFDKEFLDKLKNIRPNWFENTAEKNKLTLLEMARNGEPKPKPEHPLYKPMQTYTNLGSKILDKEFLQELESICDWLEIKTVKKKPNVAKNKLTLLEMARNGEPKPKRGHPLYIVLKNYIRNDKEFIQELESVCDWFEDKVLQKKEALLEMARNGEPKPKKDHPLYEPLMSYTKSSSNACDKEFIQELESVCDWFEYKLKLIKSEVVSESLEDSCPGCNKVIFDDILNCPHCNYNFFPL